MPSENAENNLGLLDEKFSQTGRVFINLSRFFYVITLLLPIGKFEIFSLNLFPFGNHSPPPTIYGWQVAILSLVSIFSLLFIIISFSTAYFLAYLVHSMGELNWWFRNRMVLITMVILAFFVYYGEDTEFIFELMTDPFCFFSFFIIILLLICICFKSFNKSISAITTVLIQMPTWFALYPGVMISEEFFLLLVLPSVFIVSITLFRSPANQYSKSRLILFACIMINLAVSNFTIPWIFKFQDLQSGMITWSLCVICMAIGIQIRSSQSKLLLSK